MDKQKFIGIEQNQYSTEFELNLEKLKYDGYFILEGLLNDYVLEKFRKLIDAEWNRQRQIYGENFLRSIGDWGQVRCMMVNEPDFFDLIRMPEIFRYVSEVIGQSAILHLQNGIVLHPDELHNQARYHRDFPRDFLSTKTLSLNTLFAIDPFNAETGGTWVVPTSHRFAEIPSDTFIREHQIQVTMKPGSVLIFDSMLWHKGGKNATSEVRRAINQQYTRPFIKQQISYPDLFRNIVPIESELAQTLGMWSVPPRSLDEFRVVDRSKRTYRAGQG